MTRTRRLLALAVPAVLALSLTAAVPAQAAAPPPDFQAVQVGLTYSVYGPTQTLGMPMKSFHLRSCQPGRDEMIIARFKSSSSRWVELIESQKGCVDGPFPVVKIGTFTVKGAKATMYAECPGSPDSCTVADADIAGDGGYVVVKLPSGGSGLSKTYTEMYTSGLSVADIKKFTRGLTFVG